jgi:flagellin-like hook-associated protein FlgL
VPRRRLTPPTDPCSSRDAVGGRRRPSVQAAGTGAAKATATAAIGTEIGQLRQGLDRAAAPTIPLLDGTDDRLFQVGANGGETVRVVIPPDGLALDTAGLGLSAANYRALTGTVSYDGRSFDLGSVDYTGAVTSQDHLDRLDLAALAALGTNFILFVATATELVFTGETPGAGSTAADAVALTPTYAGQAGGGAGAAITAVDGALGRVLSLPAHLGAVENRFSHTVDRLSVSVENTTAAESRIRHTDVAAEATDLTRSQVLAQAGTAMLAQANQSATLVLSLLK